jgi:serine/threonine-protein kinase
MRRRREFFGYAALVVANPLASAKANTAGTYCRLTELGRGGMATVYLTSMRGPGGLQKLVVVKEMRRDLAEDPAFRRMFMLEARVAARLDHPNVVKTHEALESDGVVGIVMEFLDGQPLNKVRTAARRELLLPLQLNITMQALAGLEHVHQHGLVHRDVSPQNIFVTYGGDVKLLDFGIVKLTDSSVQTAIGTLKGKLGYMAPEQVLGKRLDRRTDVFAMGVVLWEALTGTRIWANVPEAAIVGRLAGGSIPNVRSVKPDVPAELDAICARAMQADPDQRFATAAEFQRALLAFIARMTVQPTRRDLANLMGGLFAEQRAQLRKVIADSAPGVASLTPVSSAPHATGTIPPIAVTPTAAPATNGGVRRPLSNALVVILAVAAALIFGGAIGAVARRPPNTAAAASSTSSVATVAPSGSARSAATEALSPAPPTPAPQPRVDGSGAVSSAPKTPTPLSRSAGTGTGATSRTTRQGPPAAAVVMSAAPASVAPRPAKPSRSGEADLGY